MENEEKPEYIFEVYKDYAYLKGPAPLGVLSDLIKALEFCFMRQATLEEEKKHGKITMVLFKRECHDEN